MFGCIDYLILTVLSISSEDAGQLLFLIGGPSEKTSRVPQKKVPIFKMK